MLAPPQPLSSLQHHLLRELDLSDLPAPEADGAAFVARGLDPDEVRAVLPEMLWEGLIEPADGTGGIALTHAGAAALHAADCEELAVRLSDVSSFAGTIARDASTRLTAHALRRLAEGTWTLAEATAHVSGTRG